MNTAAAPAPPSALDDRREAAPSPDAKRIGEHGWAVVSPLLSLLPLLPCQPAQHPRQPALVHLSPRNCNHRLMQRRHHCALHSPRAAAPRSTFWDLVYESASGLTFRNLEFASTRSVRSPHSASFLSNGACRLRTNSSASSRLKKIIFQILNFKFKIHARQT